MTELSMNNDCYGCVRERQWPDVRRYADVCLERQKICQDSLFSSRDSNLVPVSTSVAACGNVPGNFDCASKQFYSWINFSMSALI
jgi:hypothetical protein